MAQKYNTEKNLNSVVTTTASSWKVRAKKDRANRRNITRAQEFALELMDYMDLHKIKQTELAGRMGVSAQQVNKILRAKSNLTFETLDKIAIALGATISSPKIQKVKSTYSSVKKSHMQIVYKHKRHNVEENATSKKIIKRNPILVTTMESMSAYGYTAQQI